MCSKPKLLVILGAGSSIPCGMPSVSEIDDRMKCWAREWESEFPDEGDDVYNSLWKISKGYYGDNHYQIRPNYERVLGEMTTLASWLSPPPFGNPIFQEIGGLTAFKALKWFRNPADRFARRKHVLSQQSFLLEKLANHMRGISRKLDSQSQKLSDYAEFFSALRDRFDLGVYNLNYDTVARTAWPNVYCGFDCYGNFDPLGVIQRRDWGFLYHLHGSVHHNITEFPHQITWRDDLNKEFKDRASRITDMAQDFKSVPLTTLISGGFKLDQLLTDPYQTLYSTLIRHVQEADGLLICGYGFGDLHINRALQNRFERSHVSPPKVVILEKTRPAQFRTGRREINEFWAWVLRHTLRTTFANSSSLPSQDDRTVAELIEQGEFEMDKKRNVAIWHGGFVEALSAVEKISDWLD